VALEDPELELKIREREPRTLDAALRVAQRFEVFRNAVRLRKQRISRQVTEDSWSNSSSGRVEKLNQDVSGTSDRQPENSDSGRYGRGTSTKAINKRDRKAKYSMNRAAREVGADDWKEEMLKKVKDLEQSQQAAEASRKKIAAENEALSKEVDNLRHIEHLRAVPNPPPKSTPSTDQSVQ